MEVHLKQKDSLPDTVKTLEDRQGSVDLSGAQVFFWLKDLETGEVVIEGREVQVTDAENGEVRLDWQEEDTELEGDYAGEFVAEWLDGKKTFPNHEKIPVKIHNSIRAGAE